MVRRRADRTGVVVAYGGGIVTDMAGFLAAIFMRGIAVLQIPTTLLAQVDAAVGGKTGVNLIAGKNLSDTDLLKLMAVHPELIQRPIVARGEKAVLARPVENLSKLIM